MGLVVQLLPGARRQVARTLPMRGRKAGRRADGRSDKNATPYDPSHADRRAAPSTCSPRTQHSDAAGSEEQYWISKEHVLSQRNG